MNQIGCVHRDPRRQRMWPSFAASSGMSRQGPVARRLRIQSAQRRDCSSSLTALGEVLLAGFQVLERIGTPPMLLPPPNGMSPSTLFPEEGIRCGEERTVGTGPEVLIARHREWVPRKDYLLLEEKAGRMTLDDAKRFFRLSASSLHPRCWRVRKEYLTNG